MAKTVSLREVFPGSVLAAKVITPAGMVLLPAGVKLTRELLEKIRKFGVHTIKVE
ncbi:hypothetical protein [Paenibacillus gorillae]|uniref:hypothetical protein n=1 Tax=Paenibacillus gorillae TaxID=1243662 RepID=UPI0004B32E73|nr:hypothetical protein [Paenibacillus gorillae]